MNSAQEIIYVMSKTLLTCCMISLRLSEHKLVFKETSSQMTCHMTTVDKQNVICQHNVYPSMDVVVGIPASTSG